MKRIGLWLVSCFLCGVFWASSAGHAESLSHSDDQVRYLVIDLSPGAQGTHYSYRFSTTGPDISDNACRTYELWLREIPAGSFVMGNAENDDHFSPLHPVILSKSFYMGIFEVTQCQWQLVMGDNPSKYQGYDRPVEQVSYYRIRGNSPEKGAGWPEHGHQVDADSFMGRLQAKTGLILDLPTECHWEYACRAGTVTALNSGKPLVGRNNNDPNMNEVGRYSGNVSAGIGGYSDAHTRVGSYLPNAWGLYDMHGNVWESCLEKFGEGVFSVVPGAEGTEKVVRGGSYRHSAWICTSAFRFGAKPHEKAWTSGFRVMMSYGQYEDISKPAPVPDSGLSQESHSDGDPVYYLVIDVSAGPQAERYPWRITAAMDASEEACRTTEIWLREIPTGRFTMGSPKEEVGRDNDEWLRMVHINESYFMGVFEVTQRQWELVMGANPSAYVGYDRPVDSVNYDMIRGGVHGMETGHPVAGEEIGAKAFLGKLQAKTGLKLDLPTDAQWEFACRAGTLTPLNSGKELGTPDNEEKNVAEVGRFVSNCNYQDDLVGVYQDGTARVGSFQPNAWGLYDMHGNVWEWCRNSMEFPMTDSATVPDLRCYQVMCGGYYESEGRDCRSANRTYAIPSTTRECNGFRLSLTTPQGFGDLPEADEEAWLGRWLTDPVQAKVCALKHHRPLLVVGLGGNEASACLQRQALDSAEFLAFARERKLVLFKTTEATTHILNRLMKDYGALGVQQSLQVPFMLLFRVSSKADAMVKDDTVFSPQELDLVKVVRSDGAGEPCLMSWVPDTSYFGVKIPKQKSWDSGLLADLLRVSFPNTGWNTLCADDFGIKAHPVTMPDFMPEPAPDTDEEQWLGQWLTDPVKAKQFARKNRRPLLVASYCVNCAPCEAFKAYAIETPEFRDFAIRNRIVLFKTENSTADLHQKLGETYGHICEFKRTPMMLFLFKVKEAQPGDPKPPVSDDFVFSPALVDLLKVTWSTSENPYCGKLIWMNESPFGVSFGAAGEWNPSLAINLVSRFFPNTAWNGLVRPPYAPEFHENALDFGRLANADHVPGDIGGWGMTPHFDHEELSLQQERWYAWTGDCGKRYHFTLRNLRAPSSFPVQVSFFKTVNGRPVEAGSQHLSSEDIQQLQNGFYVDTPKGNLTDQTYYMRLAVSWPWCDYPEGTASYSIVAHETVSAPEVGALTNPVWRHDSLHPQQLGQWSMDYGQTSLKQAYDEGRPVLVYVTGMAWCPYCLRMNHMVMLHDSADGQALRDEIAQSYPVVLDFPQRDGTGPCLLRDWQPGGYLAVNNLTASQAEQQLKDNETFVQALSLPGNGVVYYPTLVFCRVVKRGGTYELEPVGRFDAEVQTPTTALEQLHQFRQLFDAGFCEVDQFPGSSNTVLNGDGGDGVAGVALGGPVKELWFSFTANKKGHQGESWYFDVVGADGLPSETEVNLTVYDAAGTRALCNVSTRTPEVPHLLFVPENDQVQTDYRLKISTEGLAALSHLQLFYQQKLVISEVTLADKPLRISRYDASVSIPLQVRLIRPHSGTLELDYRVVPTEISGNSIDAGSIWRRFSWDGAREVQFKVPVHVPANEPDWSGSKRFEVEFKSTESCMVQDGTKTQVQVVAHPCFVSNQFVDLTLLKGMFVRKAFPACVTPGTSFRLMGHLPEGLVLEDHLDDSQNPRITLSGNARRAERCQVYVQLAKNCEVLPQSPHTLRLSIQVEDSQMSSLLSKGFVGSLRKGQELCGSVLLEKTSQGLRLRVQTLECQSSHEATVPDWSSFDPRSRQLTVSHRFADGSRMEAQVDERGLGQTTFTNPQGFVCLARLHPVTDRPKEFEGVYTVVFKNHEGPDGQLEGWATVHVDGEGKATTKLQLLHGDVSGTVEGFVIDAPEGAEMGHVELMLPLDWKGHAYEGLFASTLSVVPQSGRDPSGSRVWLSDGEVASSLLTRDEHGKTREVSLSACGTEFDPSRSLLETLGEDRLIFVADPIGDRKRAIASCVEFEEKGAFDFVCTPGQGTLIHHWRKLEVNKSEGTFTLDIVAWNLNSRVLGDWLQTKGIWVPTRKDCCGAHVFDAIGYGYFRYPQEGGEIYRVRFFRAVDYVAQQMEKPVLSDYVLRDGNVTVRCQAPDDMVICWGEKEARAFDLRKTGGLLTLPGTHEWQVISVPVSEAKRESQPVTIGRIAAGELTTFQCGGSQTSGVSTLTAGWNLVAVPSSVVPIGTCRLEDKKGKPYPCYQYDESAQTLILARTLQSGLAYWVYVRKGTAQRIGYQALQEVERQPEPLKGWGLRAYPTRKHPSTVIWRYQNGAFRPVEDNTGLKVTEGVWMYQP